jgi:4-hydroxybenzoate polyprenyltransferase
MGKAALPDLANTLLCAMLDIKKQFPLYLKLMRVDRPIGTLLVLWPTLWSLWIAAGGWPDWKNLIIFVAGCFLMRSAGCVINDYADRHIDLHVKRTRQRPLTVGKVHDQEALLLFAVLSGLAFILVLFTNRLTILLSLGGLALAACYPFMKRYTHLPQLVLGAAFSWSTLMAFAAQRGELPPQIWLLFTAVVIWTVVYDTFYAMVDRADDLKIGVKSTAILFGDADRIITAGLQLFTLFTLVLVGQRFELGIFYYISLLVAAALFAYQQYLIKDREQALCFKAFLNNNWVGASVFAGIFLHFQFPL